MVTIMNTPNACTISMQMVSTLLPGVGQHNQLIVYDQHEHTQQSHDQHAYGEHFGFRCRTEQPAGNVSACEEEEEEERCAEASN